jgi:hypothetical protein
VPRFDHSWPLQSFAVHAHDGFLHALPSWAQLGLRIGAHEFRPGKAITGSREPLTTTLDLRTGEATLSGHWMIDGHPASVRIRMLIPRNVPFGAFWELELDELPAQAEMTFGLDGDHLANDLDQRYAITAAESTCTAHVRARARARDLHLGLRPSCRSPASCRIRALVMPMP